jgi:hypothetical protein
MRVPAAVAYFGTAAAEVRFSIQTDARFFRLAGRGNHKGPDAASAACLVALSRPPASRASISLRKGVPWQ